MGSPPLNPRYVVTADRQEKAAKIEAILHHAMGKAVAGLSILDVGVGTGEIIDYFAGRNQTFGVDVDDQRVSRLSAFSRVQNERLPFGDDTFDVVISNHVVEHVESPGLHAQELARVVKPGGVVYLATPNRWFPKETHFKLWLLHYLPDGLYFTLAARLGRHGDRFRIFRPGSLARLVSAHGFRAKDYTGLILADPKRFHATAVWPIPLGRLLGHMLSPLSPTLIYLLFPERSPKTDEARVHSARMDEQ